MKNHLKIITALVLLGILIVAVFMVRRHYLVTVTPIKIGVLHSVRRYGQPPGPAIVVGMHGKLCWKKVSYDFR